jgi:hypothetical protein
MVEQSTALFFSKARHPLKRPPERCAEGNPLKSVQQEMSSKLFILFIVPTCGFYLLMSRECSKITLFTIHCDVCLPFGRALCQLTPLNWDVPSL